MQETRVLVAAELFQRHHLSIFRYLKRMTGSREQAEELTQEVFLRVVRTRSRDGAAGREKAWLFTIARNLLLNLWRDGRRRPETLPLDETLVPGHADVAAERIGLERALARLPVTDREVFLMRELGGLGYDEISGICSLTPDAVRSRIYRARLELREALRGTSVPSPREDRR
jgi:RNA polymerase sigma-70 factor (ECF subfamily)